MARGGKDRERHEADGDTGQARRDPDGKPLSKREVLRLIFAAYWTSLPYLLIFLAGLLLATWLITALLF